MARLCEVDECGVLAIGLCRRCSRGFCASHQSLGTYGPDPAECQVCQRLREAPAAAAMVLASRRAAWVRDEARAVLTSVGARTLGFYTVTYYSTRTWRSGFQSRQHQQARELGRGWKLGTFGWIFDDLHELDHLETLLPVDPRQANTPIGLVVGTPMSGMAGVSVSGMNKRHELDGKVDLFHAVRKIVGSEVIPDELK